MEGGKNVNRKVSKMKALNPKAITKKKVAAYARVSSGKDAMLHSLSNQISYYSRLIQSNPKWDYIGVYADESATGTKDSRIEFQKLLKDCRNKKIDLVITKSISRFARNTLTLLATVRELKELNVEVYFEKENIYSLSGDGELMLTILASFFQAESYSVSENCKWRIRKRFADGELVNLRFLYGYDIGKNEISVNEKEAEVVRKIFNDYLEGKGTTAIAKKLRELKIKRPRGGTWTSERVAEILKNEKHSGSAILQKKFVLDHLSKKLVKNKGELPKYYVEESHPKIISKEIFEKAQDRLAKNSDKTKKPKKKYVLTKKIVCGKCGKNYNRKAIHGRVYWGCSTYLHFGKDSCPSGQIPENILIEKINEVLELDEFDERVFKDRIDKIIISETFKLIFEMKDSSNIESKWNHKSRSYSWDNEKREEARIRELERRKGVAS
jgi:DNA invertase Pin-like site-specific DNA recombinase